VTNSELWKAVLGELEVTLSRANFTTWFQQTEVSDVSGGVVTVSVPSIFIKEWLENKYHEQIFAAVKHILAPDPVSEVVYRIGSGTAKPVSVVPKPVEMGTTEPAAPTRVEAASGTVSAAFNPKYRFANYVIGGSNKLAFATASAVAENPGHTYNPLFLYGGVGLGKTHLMHAIGNHILEEHPKRKVVYVTSERLLNELVSAISSRKTNQFKDRYRKIDVLLVDDIQFIAGKETLQEEFFHTFNALHEQNKQIILSSDRPPKAIPTLEDRLRSRFEWGMTADIQPPDLETRMAILKYKCEQRGYQIPPEVIEHIARGIQHNIRELEGALTRIMAYSELHGTEPTVETSQSVLSNIISNPKRKVLTPPQIIERVAAYYGLTPEELTGPKRDKQIAVPRQIAMYLMREELGLSFPKIGQELGGRDHSTAMHATSKISKSIEKEDEIKREVGLVREQLYVA
jgi:chromosomal replication initiator protein